MNHLIDAYLKALAHEASLYAGQSVDTVYVGGGTPTHLTTVQLKVLFLMVRKNFTFKEGCEITAEVNPATLDSKKIKVLQSAGVNRVSLGVQSLKDKYLAWLGRSHDAKEAVATFRWLRKAGFKNINLDLIYSLPGQTERQIRQDVVGLVDLAPEHISLYALSISEGSIFQKRKIRPVSSQKQAEHYGLVAEVLKKNGYAHYEVSNFARVGYACRHNINYWRGGAYIGLGAGAHSYRGGARWWNTGSVEDYINKLATMGSARIGEEKLSPQERFMEIFLIGLRLTRGVDIKACESRFGGVMSPEKNALIDEFARHGFLLRDGSWVRATMKGMVILDEICGRLI
jgi:oxygen-independent coproporphyrinogen-3 oxidase